MAIRVGDSFEFKQLYHRMFYGNTVDVVGVAVGRPTLVDLRTSLGLRLQWTLRQVRSHLRFLCNVTDLPPVTNPWPDYED